jgi:hypothetical protein
MISKKNKKKKVPNCEILLFAFAQEQQKKISFRRPKTVFSSSKNKK